MGRHSGNSALTISFSPPVIRITLEKKKKKQAAVISNPFPTTILMNIMLVFFP